MTQDPTRKQFFAKLLGITAAVGFVPKMVAKSIVEAPVAAPSPVAVRPETRAVARRSDAI